MVAPRTRSFLGNDVISMKELVLEKCRDKICVVLIQTTSEEPWY